MSVRYKICTWKIPFKFNFKFVCLLTRLFYFAEVADTLRREHSFSKGKTVKGYTQTLISPKRGGKSEDKNHPTGKSEVDGPPVELLSRKDKPPLPRDRPPAPPPDGSKPETDNEERPPLPAHKTESRPLPNAHNERPALPSVEGRPQLPGMESRPALPNVGSRATANVEGRPPMPLPGRPSVMKYQLPNDTPSKAVGRMPSNAKDVVHLKDRPQLPLPPTTKASKTKNEVEAKKKEPEARKNENDLPRSRTGSVGNSISLNDLTKGLGALKSVRAPPGQSRNAMGAANESKNGGRVPLREDKSIPETPSKVDKPVPKRPVLPKAEHLGRPHRPVGIIETERVDKPVKEEKPKSPVEEEPKPVPAPRRTMRKPDKKSNGSVTIEQPEQVRKPLPPPKRPTITQADVNSEKRSGKPMLPGNKPNLPKSGKSIQVKQLNLNMRQLKAELIPVAEEIQNLYRSACDIITLTEARISENVKNKSEECTNVASRLLDVLSSYRDSLGPVTRMKVNKHIMSLEESNSELTNLNNDLSTVPNAIELSRLGKMINSVIDVLATLSNCLPEL